jgi:hypothetical protein
VAEFVPHGERHTRLNVDIDVRVKFAKQPHKAWNDFSCVVLRHAEPDVADDLDVLEALPYFGLQFQNSAAKRKQRGSRRRKADAAAAAAANQQGRVKQILETADMRAERRLSG